MRISRAGGSPASFYTIQTPFGTYPVATGADPLTLTSTGGTMTITGTAASDSINFEISSSIFPTFTAGSIPFGNGTGLTQDNSNFFWDNTNKAIGVQTAVPLMPAHIVAEAGTTINSVTVASVSGASETLNSSITGSVSLIAEFAALSGSSASQNTSGTGYVASGQTIDYKIYQAITATNGTVYRSQSFESISFTDTLNDASSFSVDITLGTPNAETTHYIIEKQVNGGGFTESVLTGLSSPYEDTNFSGTASYSSWPTQYILSYTNPTAPNAATAQEINVGMGNLTENGTTYDFQIRSLASVSGTYFAEQVGTNGTPFTDANGAQSFDLQVDWTPGTGDDQVIRISTDGGSTWTYHFVGSMTGQFVYTGQTNDAAAETAWSNDISTAQLQIAFKCFSKTASPSGVNVFNPTADTYFGTITTPNVYYIFKHTLTTVPGAGARVIGDYNVGITNGQDISSGTFIEPGFPTWVSGTTATPTTYAFSGGTSRYFKLVGTNGTIYSVTPLTVSHTTSGSQYFSGSFTYPSGVTTVKILLSSDGGVTFPVSKTFTSPTTTFTLDATDTTWAGNSTITPTASVPGAARIDRVQTDITDVPHLSLVEHGNTGTRYMSLGFGIAASKSNAVSSYLAKIAVASNTGYMHLGAARLIGYSTSSFGTQLWQLGNTNELNSSKSTTTHTTVWAGDVSNALAHFYSAGDSNRGTVYFGTNSTSVGSTSKVVIQPSAGGTVALHFRRTSGFTGDNILIDENGVSVAGWGANGKMFLGTTTVGTSSQLRIGAVTGRVPLELVTNSSPATVNGGIYFNSPNFFGTDSSTNRLFVRMASTTVGTSTRIPYFDASGFLTHDADLSFDSGDTLYATKHNSGSGSVSAVAYQLGGQAGLGLYRPGSNELGFATNGTFRGKIDANGNWGIGVASPTAKAHFAAGAAGASSAPIKMNSGTLQTTPEAGAVEFLTDTLYYTQTTNTSRHPIASDNNPIGMQVFS